jgi:hypothetical protein
MIAKVNNWRQNSRHNSLSLRFPPWQFLFLFYYQYNNMKTTLPPAARLGRQALLFPLCLVLFEFATYIGNDMIQPGMLAVVADFNAGEEVGTHLDDRLSGRRHLPAVAASGRCRIVAAAAR